jgi:hypothetical protein
MIIEVKVMGVKCKRRFARTNKLENQYKLMQLTTN